ncbi:MAG TPA: DinB family protein [Planctomycetota bacterium]|nr:DinB family protein [Planctomycetota bacterium]
MTPDATNPTPKSGRPRKYAFGPLPDFKNAEAAQLAATVDEMTERVYDLIADLPPAALDYLPEGGNNTIAMLVLHMVAAEAFWIVRVSQKPLPDELKAHVAGGMQDASGQMPRLQKTAAELLAAARAIRHNWSLPFLREQTDIDRPVADGDRTITVRGALTHLVWHWTYHGGQVGLMRRLAGARYQWTFDKKIGG